MSKYKSIDEFYRQNVDQPQATIPATSKKDVNDPKIWGPSFWFTLHNGAVKYPQTASPICAKRMKGFITGIPVMLPCELCSDHATAYIEKHSDKLDKVVSTRENLFNFFVDFHNQVNIRYGKPVISYLEAYNLYI